MAIPTRAIRISGALLISVFMVGGAYVLSGPSFLSTKQVDAESTEALLASYAAKDTDTDGLPDWQEALYGTDPEKAISTKFGVTDGEAVRTGLLNATSTASLLPKQEKITLTKADLPGETPAPGSITEQFSEEFFKSYVAAGGGGRLSIEKQDALIASLMKDFSSRASNVLSSKYTIISIHSSPNASVLDYANSVENVLRKHDVPQGEADPVMLMESLIQNNNEGARPKLKKLADMYRLISTDLIAIQVPTTLAKDHLVLVQSFDSMAKATLLITNYEKDPVGVLGALSLYQPASGDLVTSFKKIAASILSVGEPPAGTPGALLVAAARSVEKP